MNDQILISELRTLIDEINQGGYFVADYEICDEDGSMCPTGHINFLPKPSLIAYETEYEGPIDAGYFTEPNDAPRFVRLLELVCELTTGAPTVRR